LTGIADYAALPEFKGSNIGWCIQEKRIVRGVWTGSYLQPRQTTKCGGKNWIEYNMSNANLGIRNPKAKRHAMINTLECRLSINGDTAKVYPTSTDIQNLAA